MQATPRFALIPRVEWFDDPDGFMTGAGQTLKEGTITGEFKLANGFLSRVEYRRDVSNIASFATSSFSLISDGHGGTFIKHT